MIELDAPTGEASPPDSGLHVRALRSALAGPSSLELAPGTCAAITGPSGSGKSLFLRMLADLDPNEGAVELDGRSRDAFSPPQWRRAVTYVPAEAGWWADDVRDHFAPAQLPRAAVLAAKLGLAPELLQGPVARLSTGERQRLAIVRAVVLDGPVLLLDEPTGALDQASTERVERLLRDLLAERRSVLLVTHDAALGARLATAHYTMADRRLTPA